jgi:hypothetical protein
MISNTRLFRNEAMYLRDGKIIKDLLAENIEITAHISIKQNTIELFYAKDKKIRIPFEVNNHK